MSDLHAAICNAVALMNVSPEIASREDGRKVHNILRQALMDYTEHPNPTPGDRRIGDEDVTEAMIEAGKDARMECFKNTTMNVSDALRRIYLAMRALESLPAAAPAVAPVCAVCDGPNTYDPQSGVCARCQDVSEDAVAPASGVGDLVSVGFQFLAKSTNQWAQCIFGDVEGLRAAGYEVREIFALSAQPLFRSDAVGSHSVTFEATSATYADAQPAQAVTEPKVRCALDSDGKSWSVEVRHGSQILLIDIDENDSGVARWNGEKFVALDESTAAQPAAVAAECDPVLWRWVFPNGCASGWHEMHIHQSGGASTWTIQYAYLHSNAAPPPPTSAESRGEG